MNTAIGKIRHFLRSQFGIDIIRSGIRNDYVRAPQFRPHVLDATNIEILADSDFLASIQRNAPFTILDVPRLANLWRLSRMTNPKGSIAEVGSFRGGSARLLADACQTRKVFVCDTFAGFQDAPIDATKDEVFYRTQFDSTSLQSVEMLFAKDKDRVTLIQGLFPASDTLNQVDGLSFVHLDVDLLKSMQDCLNYLQNRFLPNSLIVVDDFQRQAHGVDEAVMEFTERDKNWIAFPLFPGQGLLIHRSWFRN